MIISRVFNWLPWLFLISLTSFLVWYFLAVAKVQLGGDIVEYYGTTESVLTHAGVNLTANDQNNLERVLHKGYFTDPGYYITGRDGQRYPVHFFFYSLLAVPFRLVIQSFNGETIRSLYLVNVTSFIAMLVIVWKYYVHKPLDRVLFALLALFSPLISFFIWPGPDLWFCAILTVAVCAFLHKQFLVAGLLAAVASWHSQPLIITAIGMLGYYCLEESFQYQHSKFKLNFKPLIFSSLVGILALLPYIYNLWAFGVLTPWTQFQDGWTLLRGFGFHNVSLFKLYEQFFDFNFGLSWYALGLLFTAGSALIFSLVRKQTLPALMWVLMIVTAMFYQTNPGWHYGTSGYGPSRHILFAVPFLLALSIPLFKVKKIGLGVVIFAIMLQIWLAHFNMYLEPNLTYTLHHSPLAKYILNHYPSLYNPTPEIFSDRTNHTDITYPTSAIYKDPQGHCRKAYILKSDINTLLKECGTIPSQYEAALEDEFVRVASYPRTTIINQALFYPAAGNCQPEFTKTATKPFECMTTFEEFKRLTNITDQKRIVNNDTQIGVWQITFGQPLEITVPAGYSIDHTSFDGIYVTYP